MDKCLCFLLVNRCVVHGSERPQEPDFEATKNSRLCSLHFTDDDFISDRCDSHRSRGKKRGELTRKRLKPTVVPHVWPNCPSYISTPSYTASQSNLSA